MGKIAVTNGLGVTMLSGNLTDTWGITVITGAMVIGGSVIGAVVIGAVVTGAAVTGAAVTGGAVTGSPRVVAGVGVGGCGVAPDPGMLVIKEGMFCVICGWTVVPVLGKAIDLNRSTWSSAEAQPLTLSLLTRSKRRMAPSVPPPKTGTMSLS